MKFALSSQDITLAQSALHLFDQRFGGKARALLVVIAGAIPTILMILNFVVSNVSYLPQTGVTAQISVGAAALITLIGKFTPLFNSIIPPEAKADAPGVVVATGGGLSVQTPKVAPEPLPAPLDQTLPVMIHASPKPVINAVPVE